MKGFQKTWLWTLWLQTKKTNCGKTVCKGTHCFYCADDFEEIYSLKKAGGTTCKQSP